MRRFKKYLFGFLCIMAMVLPAVGQSPFSFLDQNTEVKLPRDEMQQFASVIEHVRQYYIKDVPDKKLFANAIQGMLSQLDPHSAYLDPKAMKKLKSAATGKFGGIGIEIIPDQRGALQVIAPLDDTPAKKAGVQSGDLIVKINNELVQDMTLQEAVEKIRGKPGTEVNLVIIRESKPKPIQLKIKRAVIHIQTVKSRIIDEGYGYARITFFQEPAKKDLTEAIQQLQKENKGKLKGLVLDLRGNPGGLLKPAVQVSDLFLDAKQLKPNQLIVYTKGRFKKMQVKAKAHNGDILNSTPIVVLINHGSASGSEIVAGALQDHRRAIILGEKSFGKGSVQTVFPISEHAGIKLTTALYYTPSGRSIQAEGIQPDIVIPPLQVKFPEKNALGLLSEASLEGHLPNGNKDKKLEAKKEQSEKLRKLAKEDYQLYQALNILKTQALIHN